MAAGLAEHAQRKVKASIRTLKTQVVPLDLCLVGGVRGDIHQHWAQGARWSDCVGVTPLYTIKR